jgi:PadR family transcriptional regulator, regulatory protein PadR
LSHIVEIDMPHIVKNPSPVTLGEFEVLVLTGVIAGKHDDEDAYGVTVHEEIERIVTPTRDPQRHAQRRPRDVSLGSVYTTLDRLEHKGLVESWYGGKTEDRGGRAKRYFKITGAGSRALRAALQPMQAAFEIVEAYKG